MLKATEQHEHEHEHASNVNAPIDLLQHLPHFPRRRRPRSQSLPPKDDNTPNLGLLQHLSLSIPKRRRSGLDSLPRKQASVSEEDGVSRGEVGDGKRKRGKRNSEGVNRNEQELEGLSVIIVNGEKVDLDSLARAGDGAYRWELENMSRGMSRAKLVGFMESLEGEWCGRSQRRTLVDADQLVKVLPRNWKIELAIRHRAGQPSLYCRSYVSSSGLHFKSCKDVAIFLRDQEMRERKDADDSVSTSVNNGDIPPVAEAEANLNDLYDVPVGCRFECAPCGVAFEETRGLEKHLVCFHKNTTRIFNLPNGAPKTLEKQPQPDEPRSVEAHAQQNGQKAATEQESPAIINGKFKTKCVWCSKTFFCAEVDAETMAEASGFMCPRCRNKICGDLERGLSRVCGDC